MRRLFEEFVGGSVATVLLFLFCFSLRETADDWCVTDRLTTGGCVTDRLTTGVLQTG